MNPQKDYKKDKEIIELAHKNKMIEIEAEKQAKLECLRVDHEHKLIEEDRKKENILSAYRLKRADLRWQN